MTYLLAFALGAFACFLFIGAPFLRGARAVRSASALKAGTTVREGLSIVVADGFAARLVGLLNHARLHDGDGLWLAKTPAVHTRGMRFPIDVVFVDSRGVITGVRARVGPGERVLGPKGTRHTLELAAGAAERLRLEKGMPLILSPVK